MSSRKERSQAALARPTLGPASRLLDLGLEALRWALCPGLGGPVVSEVGVERRREAPQPKQGLGSLVAGDGEGLDGNQTFGEPWGGDLGRNLCFLSELDTHTHGHTHMDTHTLWTHVHNHLPSATGSREIHPGSGSPALPTKVGFMEDMQIYISKIRPIFSFNLGTLRNKQSRKQKFLRPGFVFSFQLCPPGQWVLCFLEALDHPLSTPTLSYLLALNSEEGLSPEEGW